MKEIATVVEASRDGNDGGAERTQGVLGAWAHGRRL